MGFVVMDTRSGAFDNNGGRDYSLPLAGASTEQEIQDRRAAIYEAAERERLAVCPVPSLCCAPGLMRLAMLILRAAHR